MAVLTQFSDIHIDIPTPYPYYVLLYMEHTPERKGIFVVADGLDGAGKGTIITALKEYLIIEKGLRALDLREYWDKYKTYPSWEEMNAADVLISCEATNVWVGRAVRDEFVRKGAGYTAYDIALAFSLDRQILCRRMIIPALAAGKIILQERCVCTSLVYQPLQKDPVSREELAKLPGNALELQYAPDLLIVPLLDAEVAMERIGKRTGKNDNAVFEKTEFLKKADAEYRKPWLKEFFESKGTRVACIDGNRERKEVAKDALSHFLPLLEKLAE